MITLSKLNRLTSNFQCIYTLKFEKHLSIARELPPREALTQEYYEISYIWGRINFSPDYHGADHHCAHRLSLCTGLTEWKPSPIVNRAPFYSITIEHTYITIMHTYFHYTQACTGFSLRKMCTMEVRTENQFQSIKTSSDAFWKL